jgi:rhamnose transport system ATP-binding protein
MTKSPILEVSGIYMAFGRIDVLKDVSLKLYPGEVHALMGENGAGKSTLAKIMAGVHRPRLGQIAVNGQEVVIPNPHIATNMGIALIHQEPLSFPGLSVAENIFTGRQPVQGRSAIVNWKEIFRRSKELLSSLGLRIDPRARVRGLSIADQQMVDIAAALSQEAKVLLMDEPTAALTPNEVDRLFTIMRKLREQGTSIVFISHRLEEVFTIADRISVMRDGEMVGQRIPAETSADEIIHLMVGRELTKLFERPTNYQIGAPVLQVRNLSRAGKFQDVSFEVRAGEIVGMAGLVGAGRSFVGQSIFGIAPVDSGEIVIEGNPARISSPREAMARGLAYVPEDRQQQGLFMPMSIAQNATLPTINHLARYGWLRNEAERKATYEYVERLRIILRNVDQPVRELSGGNQQKVVLSKWLMSKPKVIILDEPTRGVDIGAKAEVHRLMGELAAQGIGILMISSELPEIMAMSDRVLVMHEGRLAACLDKSELTAERIMAAATGQMVEGELI